MSVTHESSGAGLRLYQAAPTSSRAGLLVRLLERQRLPAHLSVSAARRLGTVGLCVSVVFGVFFVTMYTSASETVEARILETYGSTSIRLLSPLVVGPSVLLSLIIFGLSRSGRVRPEKLLALGVGYQLWIALAISLLGHFIAWEGVDYNNRWSGTAVWIMMFAVMVPSTPRSTLFASSLAACTDPIALALLVGAGASCPPPEMWSMIFMPTFLAVPIAVVASLMIHRLGRDVERVKRLGSYRLVERLGGGGMGDVWRAEHRSLARPAAVKLIRREVLASHDTRSLDTAVARFEREAQVTAELQSHHTVELYDFGVSSDGAFFYVMELLRGMDLEEMVTRFGPIPPERLIHLLQGVCHSLAEAHSVNVVHRDIKPANLFICRKGLDVDFVKVLDFGLVKRRAGTVGGLEVDSKLTVQGAIGGTPAYTPPEMIVDDVEEDGRADLYSVGCVAWFALTGRTVFPEQGGMLATLLRHLNDEPEPLSSCAPQPIPPELEELVHACLHKDPASRPQTAMELSERLAQVPLEQLWTAERARRWWEEHRPDEIDSQDAQPVVANGDTLPTPLG